MVVGECRPCGWYTLVQVLCLDVLWMSVVRVMRGLGGVCKMYLAQGRRGQRGGEWMRELGLGLTNPVGTGGVLDVCLCFACGGVGEEWAWTRVWRGGVLSV